MISFEILIDEALDCLTPRARHDRVVQLIEREKQLSKAVAMLRVWEIFRDGISEQYPELLKWCPDINAVNEATK